jgi:hypothetical protein
VYIPGTKIVESRSFPGLMNMDKKELVEYMENSGYIKESPLRFSKKERLVEFKKIKTLVDMDIFTKHIYIVTPINTSMLRVKLYIDTTGYVYFINILHDIAEVPGTLFIPELAGTEIEGYLDPFTVTFYPYDISKYKGNEVLYDYYTDSPNQRWGYVQNAASILQLKGLHTEMNFDLNCVQGSQYYLTNPMYSGLLFIPTQGNEMRIWNDSFHDSNITVGLEAQRIHENRWKITVNGKTLPTTLVQQGPNNDVEIPASFTKGKGDVLIILFRINIKQTDFKIENRKPFIPLEILDSQINEYTEVVHILESIKNPISRDVFTNINTNPPGFIFNNKIYYND